MQAGCVTGQVCKCMESIGWQVQVKKHTSTQQPWICVYIYIWYTFVLPFCYVMFPCMYYSCMLINTPNKITFWYAGKWTIRNIPSKHIRTNARNLLYKPVVQTGATVSSHAMLPASQKHWHFWHIHGSLKPCDGSWKRIFFVNNQMNVVSTVQIHAGTMCLDATCAKSQGMPFS